MMITVNHLTRMRGNHVCVAGISEDGRGHVRPVLAGRLPASLLYRNGGVFEIGAVVDLGPVTPRPAQPEVEDMLFSPENSRLVAQLPWQQLWDRLCPLARPTLREIFGLALARRRRGYAYPQGEGTASLGVLCPQTPPQMEESYGGIKLSLRDAGEDLYLSVTDLRLFEADLETPSSLRIAAIQARIAAGVQVLLSVGVGRPWAPDGEPLGHWLQINNVFLHDGSDAL